MPELSFHPLSKKFGRGYSVVVRFGLVMYGTVRYGKASTLYRRNLVGGILVNTRVLTITQKRNLKLQKDSE
jgi:hypothetical protein